MQKKAIQKNLNNNRQKAELSVAFGSNCVRLSAYEWFFAGIIALTFLFFGPTIWQRLEKFEPKENYRLPYELSNNYWLYKRNCQQARKNYEVLVVGDSVIWGHYVSKNETLTGQLNEITGQGRFANLGVDGIHPAALAGLLIYYGKDIANKKVIIHFNPLWISSEKHDLTTEKEYVFNHPRLVPQFNPRIPCYKASYQKRISAVVERYVPTLSWISHIQIANLQNMNISTWTLEHPYENPIGIFNFKHTFNTNNDPPELIIKSGTGIVKQDLQWVGLDNSLQWRFFRQSAELLRKRGNDVFILVGPFNEHILEDRSIKEYQKIKGEIELWLQQNNFDYYIPATLPSQLYVDASHPLSEGYAIIAKQLLEKRFFMTNNSLNNNIE